MHRLRFRLWSLPNDESFQRERNAQLSFPRLMRSGTFLEDFEYFTVDGGVKAKYTYLTCLPKDTAFVHFHVWFDYGDKRKFSHSTRRTIKVLQKAPSTEVPIEPG
jgi:hypothetical protein